MRRTSSPFPLRGLERAVQIVAFDSREPGLGLRHFAPSLIPDRGALRELACSPPRDSCTGRLNVERQGLEVVQDGDVDGGATDGLLSAGILAVVEALKAGVRLV
jgi:hypothetical protein